MFGLQDDNDDHDNDDNGDEDDDDDQLKDAALRYVQLASSGSPVTQVLALQPAFLSSSSSSW